MWYENKLKKNKKWKSEREDEKTVKLLLVFTADSSKRQYAMITPQNLDSTTSLISLHISNFYLSTTELKKVYS